MVEVNRQRTIPQTVGIKKATNVHFQLFVYLRIVRQVVEHGKCIKENIIVLRDVSAVQPCVTSKFFNS